MTDELLEKISKLIVLEETSESDIDHLMTLIRKLQERDKNASSYPLLRFFGDWTKHTVLNHKSAEKIVVELNQILFKIKDVTNEDIIGKISQTISFERLKSELSEFLIHYNLPLNILTQKKLWLRFVVNLISIISNSTLELSKNYNKNTLNSIDGVVAVALKFTWANESLFTQKPSKKEVLILIISLDNTSTIVLPCKVFGLFLYKEDTK